MINYDSKLERISELITADNLSSREKIIRIRRIAYSYPDKTKPNPKYTIGQIAEQIKEETGVTVEQMNYYKRNNPEVLLARQLAHYKASNMTGESVEIIGHFFGGKNHATVLNSCRKISGYLQVDVRFKEKYEHFLNN